MCFGRSFHSMDVIKSTATGFGEDQEIELELCLSLGGSVRKTEKPKPIQTEKHFAGEGGKNGFSVDQSDSACVNALSKREIHAVRRQEARKKREAKQQQRRGLCRARNAPYSPTGVVWNSLAVGERDYKRTRLTECNGTFNCETNGVNLNLSVDQNALSGPYPVPGLSPFAINTMPFQCNGNDGKAKNPVRQEGTQHEKEKEGNVGTGFGPGRVEDNVKPVSNGSPVCSSSGVSDPNCSPHQGSGSSDTGTNSRQTKPDEPPVNNRPSGTDQTEQSRERSKGSVPETQVSSNGSRQASVVDAGENMGKPPKPPKNNVNSSLSPLAQMPCVTTTGNGPEGKTVNGFLCRYSKKEISIVCVCHGRCFTPGEFVRHAGGTEVSHPLRHITVVPSTVCL